MSNYKKAVVTHGYGCSNGDNVNQYTYSGHWNERWILEPVTKDVDLGAKYAMDNYNQTVYAYPRFTDKFGGDCTNFVSQCMLASGIHYNDNWQIYRKNGNYTEILQANQKETNRALEEKAKFAEEHKNVSSSNIQQDRSSNQFYDPQIDEQAKKAKENDDKIKEIIKEYYPEELTAILNNIPQQYSTGELVDMKTVPLTENEKGLYDLILKIIEERKSTENEEKQLTDYLKSHFFDIEKDQSLKQRLEEIIK